ncbi:MAG: hypothetical protein H7239_03745 [Flavobacterium sp.]|nr:hypothetical protein [Flavobacterium sp.]
MRKITLKREIIKILKILGVITAIILVLLFILPILFPTKLSEEIKNFANQKLKGKIEFKEAKLSFYNHFPSLTVSLTEFSLKGSRPFQNQKFIASKEIAFGINLMDLIFEKRVNIDRIFLTDALINIKVNEKGIANYNVYNSNSKSTDTTSTALKLDNIKIENSHLLYTDKSVKVFIDAKGFDYEGQGDLNKSIFDLKTEAKIKDFNFIFRKEQYLKNKKIDANLITKINTNSLALLFKENNLMVNKLPIDFVGQLLFLKNGYDLNFNVASTNSKLEDFFTALPPKFVTWLEKTKVEGTTSLSMTLKGKYIVSENIMPDLHFGMKIRKGSIKYNKAPVAATNLFLNLDAKLPSLNNEKLQVNVDSIYFNLDKNYLKAKIKTEGLSKPTIDLKLLSIINLEQLNRTLGFENMVIKGGLNANIISNGTYDNSKNLFPITKGKLLINDGYIKTNYYPNPITNIKLDATVLDSKGTFNDLKIAVKPASLLFEGNPVYVNATLQNLQNIIYDIKAKGEVNVARIYKVFSRKGLELKGYVKADLALKGSQLDASRGNYKKLNNSGTLILKNIETKSAYLPKPFLIKDGLFIFKQDKMNFKNFKAKYGSSDFVMNGHMQNVIDFALSKNGVLKGKFDVNSNYFNVDELMSNSKTTNSNNSKQSSSVIMVPPNYNLNLLFNAKKIVYGDLKLENLIGNSTINKGKFSLTNSSFNIIGSTINMDVNYANKNGNTANFDMNVKAKDFDIKRAYNEINMFQKMVTVAKTAEGIISLDYKISGKLNNLMMPIYPSLVGGGTVSVKQVKIKGFKMFGAVSKKTKRDAMNSPDVSNIDINTTIKNNIINIERFRFKVAGFRPKIEGQTSFDGQLSIKMRLGLPPFGIFGIPLKITGTQDKPVIKLGRKTEDLKEIEYENPKKKVVKP